MPEKKTPKKRKCKICGRVLSIYNKSNECWHHSINPDATGDYNDHIGIGNNWVSQEGHARTNR